jgi:hypothetical protein
MTPRIRRPGLAAALVLVAQGCGTQEWAFYEPGMPADDARGLDEGGLDGQSPDAGDADDGSGDVTPFPDDGAGDACDPDSSRCPVSCAGGAPCPTIMPVCTQHLQCVPCKSNQDCQTVRSGPLCATSGACLPECNADRDCPMSRPHCDRSIGRCVAM